MQTEVMQITLPTELAERIRRQVRSGAYSNESEVVVGRFSESLETELTGDELEHAFQLGFEALAEVDRDPSCRLTAHQVQQNQAAQHARTLRAR